MSDFSNLSPISVHGKERHRTCLPSFGGKCLCEGPCQWGAPAKYFWGLLHRFRLVLLGAIAAAAYFLFLWGLRNSSYLADPMLDTFLEMAGSLIAFTFAANAMIRFRGMHDRISLILAFGFILAGLIEAGASMTFFRGMLVTNPGGSQISLAWLAGRTLLGYPACLPRSSWSGASPLLARPRQRNRRRHSYRGAVAYLTSVFYFMVPRRAEDSSWRFRAAALGSAAGGYLCCGHHRLSLAVAPRNARRWTALSVLRRDSMSSATSRSAESQRALDAPFTLAHVLMVLSYVVVLGGTLAR